MYGVTDSGIVNGLGKPTIKFEFDTNDDLKRFLNDNKETLIENYVDVEPESEKTKRKALNGIENLQNYSSVNTSLKNNQPKGFKLIDWQPNTVNLDLGGGRTEYGTQYLKKKGVDNLIFDFNKSAKHNQQVAEYVLKHKVDTVTCFNVLNVIDTEKGIDNMVLMAAKALKPNGIAYFQVYTKKGEKGATQNNNSFQQAEPLSFYMPFVERYFDVVEKKGDLIIAKQPIKTSKKSQWQYAFNSSDGLLFGQPSADLFNVPESRLKCAGFVPTYERLSDYSHLIDNADHTDQLTGYGFDKATIDTLIDTCQRYRSQVSKLAAHLKADTPAQSAFNIWHWLHCNVKYNYDSEGKEEIRTPARTWADRHSGVDCDCLSVFTACLLIDMGYAPKFEIVAFSNKPQYSHIFVNLDGMAIDRVLPTFNCRPSLITKTLFMDIPVYRLSGVEDVALQNTLQGLYDSTLSKIAAGTASKKDKLDFRKTQVLVSLQGTDYNAFRLAGIIMPYVKDMDEQGGYYFDNEEIAGLAAAGENELIAAELRGADEITLGKIFKKLKKAIKKVAKKVATGVKKVAKATATAVKTVAKQTAKVTKAAVKSTANAVKATANVVKAGAQAAAGKGKAAKATLKKAGQQVKKAVVQPVKTVAKATQQIVKKAVVQPVKTAVKVTVINPTKAVAKTTAKVVKATGKAVAKAVKTVVKIAGKMFKVIFVKLNPVTVLMRNSLRLLIAINFLGMATRLNVANMSKTAALAAGYTEQMWNDAKKAKDRVVRFFTKIGGKKDKIEKSIVNGAKKKAIFKKDYKPTQKIVENGDDAQLSGVDVPILSGLDGLSGPASIGAALASVGAFLAKIWKWICKIVPKIGKGIATAAKKTGNALKTAAKKTGNALKTAAQKTGNALKKAADKMPDGLKDTAKQALNILKDNAIDKLKNKIDSKTDNQDLTQPQTATKKSNLPLILGIAAGTLLIGGIAIAASNKKKRA